MNAIMHRDYQSNMPIRLYQFDDRIEIMNAGGLYGNARPGLVEMVIPDKPNSRWQRYRLTHKGLKQLNMPLK